MNEEFWPIISGAFGGAASAGVFKGPINTLQDFWDITLGIRVKSFADKKRAEAEQNLIEYKKDLVKNLQKIPQDRIKEPDLYIVGPALEASNFYIEEEEIRNMFSKLISSNMDKMNSSDVHPAFVEIIKQCSKLDALILKSVENIFTQPLYSIRQQYSNGGYFDILENFYLHETITRYSLKNISESISNLERLGLIKITNQEITNGEDIRTNIQLVNYFNNLNIGSKQLKIISHRLDFTPLGKTFIITCVL